MKPAFIVETSKIVGTPENGFWSQVHTFFPQEQEKKEQRGDLLAILVVSGTEEGVEAVSLGREILGRLHEEYYGEEEGTAFERLGLAVKKVCSENEGIEIVAASLFGQAIYLAIFGQGKALLKRGNRLGIVLQGASNELQTGSGILEAGDLLVLGSEQFFKSVATGVIKVAMNSQSTDEAVETLAPIVLGQKQMANAAAILALIKKSEEPLIKSVASIQEPVKTEIDQNKGEAKKEHFISSLFSRLRLPRRRTFFVRREQSGNKKKTLFGVSVVLLLFLTGSLVFGLKNKATEQKLGKVKGLATTAEEKFNEGKTVYQTNPQQGRSLVTEAQKIADEGLSVQKDDQLVLLKQQTEQFLATTDLEATIPDPLVFMDLSLINDGGSGNSFSLSGKNLVILDAVKKKIYLLDIEKKSHEVIDYPTSEGISVVSGEKAFILDKQGIYEVNLGNKSVSQKVNKDSDWKEVSGFGTFSGNLYLLDKGSGQIWRYLTSASGFSAKNSWFVDAPPDLSSAVSMTIDGSIWVLKKDKILKFTLSKQDSFSLSKMPETFADPVKIYTSDEQQNLYVLDKGRKKVYVIDKNGAFKSSYAWNGIEQATDLVAVESLKKIFLLSGAKIYEIGMK